MRVRTGEYPSPTAFYDVCERGDLSRVREFILHGVDINAPDRVVRTTPLHRRHMQWYVAHNNVTYSEPARLASVVGLRHLASRHAADIWRSCRSWFHMERK